MALIKFGGGVIQMSGSIAGNTYARNHYGGYVRARTKPVNPNTNAQQKVRDAMASLTTRWSQTVTHDQRVKWNEYGAGVDMKNRLSETINLTGFNHYLRSNIPRVQSDLPIIDPGPIPLELPAHDPDFAIVANEGTGIIAVTFKNTMDWASETGAYLITYQGHPQNAQRNFFAGPWRLLDNIPGKDADPPGSPDNQTAVIEISQFQRQWVYARILRKDGRISEPFRNDCFVGA